MKYDISIASYAPAEGGPGTTLTITLAHGIEDVPRNCLVFLGGLFEKDGKVFATGNGAILDQVRYTEFQLVAPPDLEPGDYNFEMYLGTSGKAVGDTYFLKSDFPFTVKAVKPDAPPKINSIIPNEISRLQLPDTNFLVRGSGLTQVDRTRITLMPGGIRMGVSAISDQSLNLRAQIGASASILEPGNYVLRAYASGGGAIVYSNARLKIIE